MGAEDPLESITSYEFMFYASAIVAVFQLVEVSMLIYLAMRFGY